MTLTSKMKPYKFGFGPYAPEVYRMPYAYCYRCAFGLEYPSCELHCAYFLREFFNTHISSEQVAAVLAEPVLGEGGFVVHHRSVELAGSNRLSVGTCPNFSVDSLTPLTRPLLNHGRLDSDDAGM